MSNQFFVAILGAAVGLCSLPLEAARAELPSALQAGDSKLALNGSGTRTKYLMSMYEAGLYLDKPSTDAAAIVAADAPMGLRLQIVSGMVTQEKLVESLAEGFDKSTLGKTEPIRKEIEQFRSLLGKEIAKGDVFDFVYTPQQGVIVAKNGKTQGTVAGLAFKKALFGIWLSENPADKELKRTLLLARGPAGSR